MTKPCPISFWFVTQQCHFSLKQYFLWKKWDSKSFWDTNVLCSEPYLSNHPWSQDEMSPGYLVRDNFSTSFYMNQPPLLHCVFILSHLSQELVPSIRKLNFWVWSSSGQCLSGGELLREWEGMLEKQCFCRVIWWSANNVKWKAEREIMSEKLLAVGGCLSVQRAQCHGWSQHLIKAEISDN